MSILRKILLPFSYLYGAILDARNFSYEKGLLESRSFPVPVICVGNLSVGGTGKTPLIEYLLRLLLPQYKTATLSRGYGRKSKGYLLLTKEDRAERVGDEPLQFKKKFPEAIVAVDENRQRGISNLLAGYQPEVVLLDDAFQHRKVKAGLNILLTSYEKVYIDDTLLPAGNLREPVKGAARADIIIVTKCPPGLGEKEQAGIRFKLRPANNQKVYFSFINYSDHIMNREDAVELHYLRKKPFCLVTGIANPGPLVNFLRLKDLKFDHLKFPDHHIFSSAEIETIREKPLVLTTEKDFMRLEDALEHRELYYLPIKMDFLNGAKEFEKQVVSFINEK